jgi:hypothetical protein
MSNSVPETSLSADIFRYIRYQLRGRRGLIAAAVTLGIPALWLSWPWLVVAGIAPILIAIAPCAIMCALGLCGRHFVSGANQPEAGSNVTRSQTSCCSQAPSVEETPTTSPAKKQLTHAPTEAVEIAAVPKSERNPANDDNEFQAEDVPLLEDNVNPSAKS